MKNSLLLTIAIPTYNRNARLLENLQSLLPQIAEFCDKCCLLVLDNCSDEPVESSLREVLRSFPTVQCEVVQHRVNIGANANIMRCVENCSTPWIWVLGDDDPVQPRAVATILETINSNPDGVLLNFSSDGVRRQSRKVCGVEELATHLDASADLPWISSSVYNAKALLPHLKLGYLFSYSLLPHVVTMLAAVGENGACFFSTSQIVDAAKRKQTSDSSQGWALIPLALGYGIVGDLPLPSATRALLLQKLLVTRHSDGIGLGFLWKQLWLLALQGDLSGALYIYDQTCARSFYFDRRFGPRAKRQIGRLMLRFPHATKTILSLLRHNDFGSQSNVMQDRYGRL